MCLAEIQIENEDKEMVVDLKESREKIDKIDREITRLFEEDRKSVV